MTVSAELVASLQPIATLVAVILTFGILSILIGENPFYRVCEHIFVGSTAAQTIVATFAQTIKPGIQVEMMQNGKWWEIIPIVIGLLIYFQPVSSLRWLSRIPMTLWIGYNAGMVLTVRTAMPLYAQTRSTMLDLFVTNSAGAFDAVASFNNLVFFLTFILTMLYFFFSFQKLTEFRPVLVSARWVMMIAFGASFGSTVMSRVSLFLGRLTFLFHDWLGII